MVFEVPHASSGQLGIMPIHQSPSGSASSRGTKGRKCQRRNLCRHYLSSGERVSEIVSVDRGHGHSVAIAEAIFAGHHLKPNAKLSEFFGYSGKTQRLVDHVAPFHGVGSATATRGSGRAGSSASSTVNHAAMCDRRCSA